jgi:hypothetical protein
MPDETNPVEEIKTEPTKEEGAEPAGEPAKEAPQAQWEFKTEFAITGRMKELVHKTVEATEAELTMLRRKLERLTYGG